MSTILILGYLRLVTSQSTGVHTVADIFCVGCGDRVGWYYHKASDQSQKYKEGELSSSIHPAVLSAEFPNEGKYLLERERLVKDNAWTLDA